jgi:hypothetical protein
MIGAMQDLTIVFHTHLPLVIKDHWRTSQGTTSPTQEIKNVKAYVLQV